MINDTVSKRGRKPHSFSHDDFLESVTAVAFAPSRLTREQIVYGMVETGISNRSAYIAWALKTAADLLAAESLRRQRMANLEHPDLEAVGSENYKLES
jgi:hypothetical protein